MRTVPLVSRTVMSHAPFWVLSRAVSTPTASATYTSPELIVATTVSLASRTVNAPAPIHVISSPTARMSIVNTVDDCTA